MPCGVWKMTGVSDADLGIVVAGYKIDKPDKIETVKENGKWTVVATFPPCDAPPEGKRDFAFGEIKKHLSIASIAERLSS